MIAKGRAALVGMVAAGCLIAPVQAGAATTIGSDLSVDPNPQCGANPGEPCNFTSQTLPSGAAEAGSPVAGVVVSARIRTAGVANDVTVRVLRENAMTPFAFLNVGPEAIVSVTEDATMSGHVTEATGLHLPIAIGDRLGVGYTMNPGLTYFSILGVNAAAQCAFHQGAGSDHPVGTERSYNNAGCAFEVLVQGTVEPDADGDRFGDETQDQCPTNAAVQTACPPAPGQPRPKAKCKKKKKKRAESAKKCKKKKKKR